jgi:hypothetical protein
MVDPSKVGETCAEHGLRQRADDNGTYWVHPDFEDALMIDLDDNGNWEDGTPEQQAEAEKEFGTKFNNASIADLDRYLTAFIQMLREAQHDPAEPSCGDGDQ